MNIYTMTHTQLDHDFLSRKHSLVHQITRELLGALEAGTLSREAGQELAIDVLEAKDTLQTDEELLNFLKQLATSYPFLRKLHQDFQASLSQSSATKEFSKEDNVKLEQIQNQLSKLSGSA